jgi:hypothetical protein
MTLPHKHQNHFFLFYYTLIVQRGFTVEFPYMRKIYLIKFTPSNNFEQVTLFYFKHAYEVFQWFLSPTLSFHLPSYWFPPQNSPPNLTLLSFSLFFFFFRFTVHISQPLLFGKFQRIFILERKIKVS